VVESTLGEDRDEGEGTGLEMERERRKEEAKKFLNSFSPGSQSDERKVIYFGIVS
jgi:hypothetical protein